VLSPIPALQSSASAHWRRPVRAAQLTELAADVEDKRKICWGCLQLILGKYMCLYIYVIYVCMLFIYIYIRVQVCIYIYM
jgi:hypothetical protein